MQSWIASGFLLIGLLFAMPALGADRGVAPPLGFQIYCLQNPESCSGGGASSISASGAILKQLNAINRKINRSIRPRSDGRVDTWSATSTSGDCEDYVLAKRQALIAKGFPPSALRIAYVTLRSGEGHALLVVSTDDGDFALDNLSNTIRRLSHTGYRVQSMSGANPLVWN